MAHNWVHQVRCSLLGLEVGATPSKKDINTSEHFMPQAAASESKPPEVIADHWLAVLQEQCILAECHPNQFTAVVDWVPLYTLDGLEKHLPAALSAFVNAGPPSLTAVVPPEFHMGTDREFLLTNFHRHECLVRQLISIGGRCRQLNLLFVCGGYYSKSFPHGQALNKHMRTPLRVSH